MSENNTKAYIYVGNTVKAIGGGRVEGYLVPFTSPDQRDLDGEYFNSETELHLKDHPVEGLRVMYQHGLDETLGVKTFGKIIKARIDDVGLWVQAQLDLADEYQKAVYELAESGKLGWSSGALPQSVKVDASGHIKSWAIIEGSLTPTPAMPFKTIITAKSKLLAEVTEDVTRADDEATRFYVNKSISELNSVDTTYSTTNSFKLEYNPQSQSTVKDKKQMDKEQIIALLDQLMALVKEDEAMMAMDEDELKTVADEVQKSATELKSEVVTEERVFEMFKTALLEHDRRKQDRRAQLRESFKASAPGKPKSKGFVPHNQVDETGNTNWQQRVSVGENLKYAGVSVGDLAFAVMTNKAAPAEWVKQLAGKAEDAINDTSLSTKRRAAIKSALPFKANEIDGTGNTGYGEEWVATMWTGEVWYQPRFDTLYDRFVSKGLVVKTLTDAGTVTFSTEGAFPTAYTRPEAIDLDSTNNPEVTANISRFGTGDLTITPLETSVATSLTDRLREDSSVDAYAEANRMVSIVIQETRDQLLINGDTATGGSTNINLIDGTPATGISTPYYIAANGFRKYALVTAASYSNDAGGALSKAQWSKAVSLLPAQKRWRKANTMIICDPDTHQVSLDLPEMQEYLQTLNTGDLTSYQGHDVAPSGFLPLSNTAGKVPSGGGTLGTIMALYLPAWGVGYSRMINTETVRFGLSGVDVIVSTFRMGIATLGTGSSTAVYNIGVS